jgi:hypothetical protein
LTEHIQLAVPVLQAAKSNDQAALDKGLLDWNNNAKEIAQFLSAANPENYFLLQWITPWNIIFLKLQHTPLTF